MTQTASPPPPTRPRARLWRIALVAFVLLLILCLLASLAGNAGLTGWALWTRWQLQREQERGAALQSEVERLLEVLQENDIEPPLSPANEELMDTIEGQVAALRGLTPTRPVERALMTEDQLYLRMRQDFDEDFPEQEARDYALTLAAFDCLDPEIDMYSLLLRLYTEQIGGFYDPETEQIYVIAALGQMGQLERLLYAHEFTHALQDQHHDLEAMGYGDEAEGTYDDEQLWARQALVEGDASLTEQQFLQAHYTPGELAEFLQEGLEADMAVFDEAPAVLRESLLFPYTYGQAFVTALYEEGGWAAVDAAYADPPQSTEHILHPERYRSGDMPQIVSLPPLTDTLGTGWRQVYEDVNGEHFIAFYLGQQMSEEKADAAAEGWGGDRYAVHVRDSDSALAMAFRIAWDAPADAEEFVDAYVAYAEGRFDRAADVTDGPRLCWAGGDYLCLEWAPAETLIVLGPDETTVRALLATLGGERDESGEQVAPRCLTERRKRL